MKRKERVIVLLAALSLLLSVPAALPAGVTEKVIERTLPLAAGQRFELKNINGAVEISAWDRSEVSIRAVLRTKERDRERAQQLLDDTEIIITAEGGDVIVNTRLPKQRRDQGWFSWLFGGWRGGVSVHYFVTLPRDIEAGVKSTNGSITVANFRGALRLRTTNGGIKVKKSAGIIAASTTNGAISAELVEVDKQADISLKTTNGSIVLGLPEDFSGEINARTTNGAISSELPVTFEGTVSKRRLRGFVGEGDSDVRCELATTNGSITIRKLAGEK